MAAGREGPQGDAPEDEAKTMAKQETKSVFPPGWDEKTVRELVLHHEGQTDEEATAEDEAAFSDKSFTIMQIPVELVSEVDELLARRASAGRAPGRGRRGTTRPRSPSQIRAGRAAAGGR